MRKLYYLEHHTKNDLADIYEVAVIIGSCFIVNYVTADSKTNWAEGVSMIAFYLMIVSRHIFFICYIFLTAVSLRLYVRGFILASQRYDTCPNVRV
jgi:hypothetical protein